MTDLYKIFTSLDNYNKSSYNVADIPSFDNHKIGVSQNNYPLFFIKTKESDKNILNQSLELISIQYNKECQLYSNEYFAEEGIYTLILLRSDIPEIQKYFIDVIYLAIKKISPIPSVTEINSEINKLIELFRSFSKPPIKTIQGVWAEMLVIEQAKDIDYLVQAWHATPSSRFDFNDGIDKIEVKCTSKDKRIHRFSLSQLEVSPSSNLLIASVMTQEIGIGINIFDLRDKIFMALHDKTLIDKVDCILSKTLGRDIQKSANHYFDYHSAIDYLQYFDVKSIPSIENSIIPIQISSVKFDCDLTGINAADLSAYNSKLFDSLD